MAHTRQRALRRGFSLIELMAVLVVLGAVAALASLQLGKRNNGVAVAGLAREFFARALEARYQALSSGCIAELVLDPLDTNHDGLVGAVALATTPGMAPVPLTFSAASDGVSKQRDAKLAAVATWTDLGGTPPAGPASAGAILFYPDGTVRLASTGSPNPLGVTLYLNDALGKHPYRVAIFGSTGFARMLAQ